VRYLALVFPVLIAACASAPREPARSDANDAAAGYALKMVGKPYRYGGATPAGFDCSGLVMFSYRQAGVAVPRSTDAQRETGHPIRRSSLRRGDLIFFDLEGKKNSHVGIYLGNGRFVHAPSSGKHVRTDSLDAPFWRKHFSEARRLG
jgi:cell wall-associated NlpC family hydrolase